MLTPVILIADKQNLFIEGLSRIVREKIGPVDIVTATVINDLVACLQQHKPRLIFLNYYFICQHFHDIRPILAKRGYPEIIVLCDEWSEDARKKAASLGALKVLSKDCRPEDIWHELQHTVDPSNGFKEPDNRAHLVPIRSDALTSRQRKILQLLARGLTNREISDRIGCAEPTVKAHLNIAYKILGVKNRTQAMYVISQVPPSSEIA